MKNDFYTHREFLERELSKLNYKNKIKCLEFGTGDGSALIFSKFAKLYKNIEIKAYETNKEWLEITYQKYKLENYTFNFIENWDSFLENQNFDEIYDLVFVDQSPWEARIKTIDKLRNNAKIIILHDYDYYNKNIITDIYSVGEGSFFHKRYGEYFNFVCESEILPPTLIMYNKNIE
jgi:phospholipid N-methyltransferase